MTIDELRHIFRFQLTEDENFTPTDKVDYMLFIGQGSDRIFHDVDKLELLLTSLKDFEFQGYRDRTPLFVRPDPNAG